MLRNNHMTCFEVCHAVVIQTSCIAPLSSSAQPLLHLPVPMSHGPPPWETQLSLEQGGLSSHSVPLKFSQKT